MKKLICILLSALLILTLFSACGKQPAAEDETNQDPVTDPSKGTAQEAPPDGTPPEGTPGTPPDGSDGPGGTPPEGGPGGTPPEGGPGGTPPEGGPGGMPPGGGPGGTPPGGGPGGMPPGGGPGGPGDSADLEYKGATEVTGADSQSGRRYASSTADECALLISASDPVTITDGTVTKSGDSDGGDNCSFYGLNAAVLVKGGANVTLEGGTVSSDAKGANGVFCYGGNGGRNGAEGDGTTLTVRNLSIVTTGDGSGGIMTTGGGTTYACDLDVTTSGRSSAPIRTDRGGGTVVVDGGSFTSNGLGSPAIYSTAEIHAENATLISNLSEGVCIEGKNSIELTNCDLTANNTQRNGNASFLDTIMIYQSMSGDADSGTSRFTMTGGSLTSRSGHVFHVTNTSAVITLRGVKLVNEDPDKILLSVCDDGWSGAGNAAVFRAAAQELSGAIKVGSNSSLELELTEGSRFEGCVDGSIVNAKGETVSTETGSVSLTLDDSSKWILTGDSWLSSFSGNPANIVSNGHTVYVNGTALTGTN